jgi:hypothetical protein
MKRLGAWAAGDFLAQVDDFWEDERIGRTSGRTDEQVEQVERSNPG